MSRGVRHQAERRERVCVRRNRLLSPSIRSWNPPRPFPTLLTLAPSLDLPHTWASPPPILSRLTYFAPTTALSLFSTPILFLSLLLLRSKLARVFAIFCRTGGLTGEVRCWLDRDLRNFQRFMEGWQIFVETKKFKS